MKIYEANLDGTDLKCLTPDAKVYTAEGSYSADGKQIVYSAGTAGDTQPLHHERRRHGREATDQRPRTATTAGRSSARTATKVIFRTDRKEKDRLQLYVINADGTGEKALTDDDKWVYWAPYWYKDGKHIIYTAADHSNELARPNYDLYWMNIETGKTTRITHAPGQDVLPVFSPDCTKVMWTSQPRRPFADAALHRRLHAAEGVIPAVAPPPSPNPSSLHDRHNFTPASIGLGLSGAATLAHISCAE